MPSIYKNWITIHDDLAVLHVTSNDLRRAQVQDIALFESKYMHIVEMYTWKLKHARIENEYGKSILSLLAEVHNKGSIQIEPNCDFTANNIRRRSAPTLVGTSNLLKYKQATPNWRTLRTDIPMFTPMKYRSRSDVTDLTVSLTDGGNITIKVNKFLVHNIPTKLVFRPTRPGNQLFMPPNEAQRSRPKCNNDNRHGSALSEHILTVLDNTETNSARLSDRFNYTVNELNEFVCAIKVHNQWTNITVDGDEVALLKIILPEGFTKHSIEAPPAHMYPNKPIIAIGEASHAYFIVDRNVAQEARDVVWIMQGELPASRALRSNLPNLVCKLAGISTHNIMKPARMSKLYARAVENDNYKSRARFENTVADDKNTNNRMYTSPRFIKYRRVYCTKHLTISSTITALDIRMKSIRVGGKNIES